MILLPYELLITTKDQHNLTEEQALIPVLEVFMPTNSEIRLLELDSCRILPKLDNAEHFVGMNTAFPMFHILLRWIIVI